MQTMAIRTVTNSLPENEVILLTLLISKRYIPYTDLRKNVCRDAYLRLIIVGGGCDRGGGVPSW